MLSKRGVLVGIVAAAAVSIGVALPGAAQAQPIPTIDTGSAQLFGNLLSAGSSAWRPCILPGYSGLGPSLTMYC